MIQRNVIVKDVVINPIVTRVMPIIIKKIGNPDISILFSFGLLANPN